MTTITVFGGGSWGTALAHLLASEGRDVLLWCRSAEQARAITLTGRNPKHLKTVDLAPKLLSTANLSDAADFSPNWISAVPAQAFRSLMERLAPFRQEGLRICNVAKGIEIASGFRLSEVAAQVIPDGDYALLSGPSHAEEVAAGQPAAVVVAAVDEATARHWQELVMTPAFRVYTSTDVVGVEIGGAVKNVIAVGAGIARAMGLGDNATAALVTRGLAEIMRLGARLGANPLTLAGLTGAGDLMVTCFSGLSRNYRLGLEIGRGKSLQEASDALGEVAEGAFTVRALVEHALKLDVDIPLSMAVYGALYRGTPPAELLEALLVRSPKPEMPPLFWRE
ncbi:NAD(P)-dependent glycerol-3-phosphate dehydrogenase [Aminithiophilus ramosus]|uniref:Glycerol-3-phosphate dehydrogenase [NAD(P)+] n=2 Tax=Synergistales TaxID=649776 RepID=A0A9Q7AGL1_9BACT|nr:NAD(P)H-dependent glycerol-3-phosphate dehydrogenase [Aminithiophilus ramosus]QTX32749.1 NAD(P)-dependent glycerol-3-phosphate dehydrogenase [Aminithiophilus ramosus]QVL36626.1 NAD(P)-dependent glycerol-3-phosphate dehydrogenase [Synergistota bacterium]